MSLYPNMLYGSYGWVDKHHPTNTALEASAFIRSNVSLSDPFFGAMLSHKISEAENAPMYSFGAFVNRRDKMLDYLIEASRMDNNGNYNKSFSPRLNEPTGKLDLMFGYDLGNGIALGLGLYGAYQKEKLRENTENQTGVYKVNAGINWNLDQGLDFEASINGGSVTGMFAPTPGAQLVNVTDGDYFYRGDVRFFSAVPSINGAFVPQVGMEIRKFNDEDVLDVDGGIGINMNIDRGFFWTGIQGLYTQKNMGPRDTEESIGGRIGFGIERNIMWDWFLIRVGGQKEIRHIKTDVNRVKTSQWVEMNKDYRETNAEDELVALGFGVNIDNRLRIDFVSSNDVAYTFTNLVSSPQLALFKKISATYRF